MQLNRFNDRYVVKLVVICRNVAKLVLKSIEVDFLTDRNVARVIFNDPKCGETGF